MPILTTTEVGAFLGIPYDTSGLAEAIEQAEALVAGKLNLPTLDLTTYTAESRITGYTSQQVITLGAPIREVFNFTYADDDVTDEVEIGPGGFSIIWSEPYYINFNRVKSFARMTRISYTYSAGWTDSNGYYPLPAQVKAYVLSMAGLTLGNLLGSGVYDTKLGDMTIKIQRETLEQNLGVYDLALLRHARP